MFGDEASRFISITNMSGLISAPWLARIPPAAITVNKGAPIKAMMMRIIIAAIIRWISLRSLKGSAG